MHVVGTEVDRKTKLISHLFLLLFWVHFPVDGDWGHSTLVYDWFCQGKTIILKT